MERTHYCGTLRRTHIGLQATVCGWVLTCRDMGGVIFVDVRDREGVVQTVFDQAVADPASFALAERLKNQSVVQITGEVRLRDESTYNPALPTGEVELAVSLTVVGVAHVVHLVDVLASALDEVLDSVLVAEVVAALNCIEGMRLEAVVRVRDARDAVHAALRHRRCRARRHELRQHGNLEVLVLRGCECGAHAGTAAADDQHVVRDVAALDFFWYIPAIPGEVRSRCQDDTGCRCAFDEGTTRNFP